MKYTVQGAFRAGKGTNPFNREVDAESENHARELVYSQLSSEHSISRTNITIDDVAEA